MSVTYLEAIRAAQEKALADDPNVFLYGQDIGKFGGAFKATKNLAEKFPGRVIDSPISEDAMIGLAVGAALEGMKPVVEMQFADFSTVGLNQMLNHAATTYWRTGKPCPMVLRLPSGGTPGSGPFHSQSMLLEAIGMQDPVVFCEHKLLYYHLKAEALPGEALPAFRARIARPGRDVTCVAYSAMVHEALVAAEELVEEGYEVEVVDLRTVKPLDTDTLLGSVARTGRLLVVGESWPWGGASAEVVARVAAEGFELLDAPPKRLNAKDTPIPYHPNLWAAHRPTAVRIAAGLREVLRY